MRTKNKQWTDDEVDILMEEYRKHVRYTKYVINRVNHSASSIYNKINLLKQHGKIA